MKLQALTDELLPFGAAGVLVVIGQPDLGQPVLAAQHEGDLVQVQAEEVLQLPDPGDPGQVLFRVPAQAAGRAAFRRQQPISW